MRYAALNTSVESFFLDHIAPLASLLDIPLIVTTEENQTLAAHYYSEVQIRLMPDLEFRLKELCHEFDGLIECNFWSPQQKELFRALYKKEMQLIFCPHGQSDKGYSAPTLAPYALQEMVLLYGNLMKKMLIELKIWDKIPQTRFIGNYRLQYYKKNKQRLDSLTEKEIFSSLNTKNQTLLYAPTWQDKDNSSTFFDAAEKLIQETPSHWNLIIKIHPLLQKTNPEVHYRLLKSKALILDHFPLIYPLLEKVDAYLGDYSSINYDALAMKKPLFFLTKPHLPPARIHACGPSLKPIQNIFHTIESHLSSSTFNQAQEDLYSEAFAPGDLHAL